METRTLAMETNDNPIVKNVYLESILLIERLHRRFLDVIKAELEKQHFEDINNIQTLILYNIGQEQLTIGELTNRGYYLGSNVSYNVKKLAENEYLIQEKSPHDKRSTRVRLSEKGLNLCNCIDDLYRRHVESLATGELDVNALARINNSLSHLENFWTQTVQNPYSS